jgi:hypothetical protein
MFYMNSYQIPRPNLPEKSSSISGTLYKLTNKNNSNEYFVMYNKGVEQLKKDGEDNGYDVTEGPFPEGQKATHELIDFDIHTNDDTFRLDPISSGGRRRSKKRPTARRRRSSKRNARKSRATRRR